MFNLQKWCSILVTDYYMKNKSCHSLVPKPKAQLFSTNAFSPNTFSPNTRAFEIAGPMYSELWWVYAETNSIHRIHIRKFSCWQIVYKEWVNTPYSIRLGAYFTKQTRFSTWKSENHRRKYMSGVDLDRYK